MASCLPMSAMTVASWLMLPLWKCCASHRSRITEVGLALDAKKLMCLQRGEHGDISEGGQGDIFIKSNNVLASRRTVSHFLSADAGSGKPFHTLFYCAAASCNSVNVRFYCVILLHPDVPCWSTK